MYYKDKYKKIESGDKIFVIEPASELHPQARETAGIPDNSYYYNQRTVVGCSKSRILTVAGDAFRFNECYCVTDEDKHLDRHYPELSAACTWALSKDRYYNWNTKPHLLDIVTTYSPNPKSFSSLTKLMYTVIGIDPTNHRRLLLNVVGTNKVISKESRALYLVTRMNKSDLHNMLVFFPEILTLHGSYIDACNQGIEAVKLWCRKLNLPCLDEVVLNRPWLLQQSLFSLGV